MIRLQDVSKRYGDRIVLDGIDLELDQGKTHVFIGSSGCGKSTLIRVILGMTGVSSGSVTVDGIQLPAPQHQQVLLKMGYVVQEGGLFPHLTAEENVALVARTQGWSTERVRSRMNELKDLMGFSQTLMNRYPKQISGGQRQRVGIMRALMLDPPILLLDEPLGALDPIVRSELQEELKKELFAKLKKTVVLVTHDMGEAAYFGHTITLLEEGKIIQHGTFEEFSKNPASEFVTRFVNAQRPPPELGGIL